MTDAMDELRTCYQSVAGLTPTLTFGASTVNLLPSGMGIDINFVGGGTADSGDKSVSFLASEMATLPEDQDLVTLAGYAANTGLNGVYQVMGPLQHTDGTVTLILGNSDGR